MVPRCTGRFDRIGLGRQANCLYGASMAERVGTNALINMLGEWRRRQDRALHRRLARAIAAAVATGVLPAGATLPAERSLARALAVSRSTVTLALNDLRADGVLESRQGSGTRVRGAKASKRPGATVLPGLLEERAALDVIDLAASTPADPAALPQVDVDMDALVRAGSRHGYTPAGLPALRDAVAERLTLGGLPTTIDQVLITNGAQHGLALALNLLGQPGERVLVDEPTYPGMLDLLGSRGLEGVGLPRVAGAIDPIGLRRLVRQHDIGLAYLQTSVHNPTGWTADDWEFRQLARVCDELELTVLEDLVLADLRYDGSLPAPIAARTRRATVLVIGSLSKLGWGGLRIGWMRAPATILDRLVRARLADDLGSSVPSQLIAAGVLANFDQVAGVRQATLRSRADLAHRAITEAMPSWRPIEPKGGLSLWIQLPAAVAEPLAQRAKAHGVAIATGVSASIDGRFADHVRICFDRPEDQLIEGIRRLAQAWTDVTDGPAGVPRSSS